MLDHSSGSSGGSPDLINAARRTVGDRVQPPGRVARPYLVAGWMLEEMTDARERSHAGRLGELYLRYADDATRLAYLLTGDRALAEDMVQDAFVRLAGRLAHLRDEGAFEPYLKRTVVNLARSHWRRRKVERAHLERTSSAPGADVRTEPDLGDRDALWHALAALPARQRTALVLRFYEDMSERRIAEVLGCRPGTVKSLVSRGLARLRAEIGGEDR
jgi:RNA polymerase sigma-70 factor (sigma-E family)